MQQRLKDKTIIVTGASSGIGKYIAWHIAKNGGTPIMIARSYEKLKKLEEMIADTWGIQAFAYQADLLDAEWYTKVLEDILLEHPRINGMINNAGFGVFDYVESMQLTDMENMFQVNVLALMRGSKLVLPVLMKENGSQIVNIASQAGKIATPKSAVYAATKHAVLGFTNALRLELKNKGIYVMAVNLGPVQTSFFDTADPSGSYQKNVHKFMLDPDQVAQKIVKGLFTGKREINLPQWMNAGSKLYQLFPSGMELLLGRQFKKK